MIQVTRLNGLKFVVNADQIRYIENTPDTMIALVTGEKVMVMETLEDVVRRAIDYQRQVRAFAV